MHGAYVGSSGTSVLYIGRTVYKGYGEFSVQELKVITSAVAWRDCDKPHSEYRVSRCFSRDPNRALPKYKPEE